MDLGIAHLIAGPVPPTHAIHTAEGIPAGCGAPASVAGRAGTPNRMGWSERRLAAADSQPALTSRGRGHHAASALVVAGQTLDAAITHPRV
jgi:hypothetical protein